MDSELIICSWNANGISNKKPILINFLKDKQVDIMLINETKLTDQDKLKIKNYDVIRKDRDDNTRAGGVAILIRRAIPYETVDTTRNTSTIEHITLRLIDNTYVTAVYNKPTNIFRRIDIIELLNVGRKVLLIGDLNARHVTWNNRINNRNGNTIFDISQTEPILIEHTDKHTHFPTNGTLPTTIDIIINKNVANLTTPYTLQDLDSDHDPIITSIKQATKRDLAHTHTIWKHVNWTQYRKTMDQHITINSTIASAAEIEEEIEKFTKAAQAAKKKHCKTLKIESDKGKLPQPILDLITEKRRARKHWQRTRSQHDKQHWNQLVREVKEALKVHCNKNWTEKLKKLTHKDNSLWKMTKLLKSSRQQIPPLKNDHNTLLTDEEKSEALAASFQKAHELDMTNLTIEQQNIINTARLIGCTPHNIEPRKLQKYLTNPSELKSIAKTFSNDKTPGLDDITYRIIKNFSAKAYCQLNYIINAILKLQHFPNQWKKAVVIPVAKPGKDGTKTDSYRPISLLSGLSKLTEKIILRRLDKIEQKEKIIPNCQFGFRSGHSTTHQVVRIITDIKTNLNQNQNTVLMLLDMQKAFDKVWIDGLIYKLLKVQIPPHLCKLILSYLTQREFRVRLNGAMSGSKIIAAGVPQGSVLGPKLYTMYISDLPLFSKTHTAIYADDTAVYCHSHYSNIATKQLQIHSDILKSYFDKWKLTLNVSKTEIINFRRKITNTQIYTNLKINNEEIRPTTSVKYLGVILDEKLTYRKHIESVIQKAYISLRHLYPLMISDQLTTSTKILLYKTIVRPILTYAAPAWCGASKTNLKKLQVYENKCLRLATSSNRYTRLTELYDKAAIQIITDYIQEESQKFYQKLTNAQNPLLSNITKHRHYHGHLKHKLPYQHLPIFNLP